MGSCSSKLESVSRDNYDDAETRPRHSNKKSQEEEEEIIRLFVPSDTTRPVSISSGERQSSSDSHPNHQRPGGGPSIHEAAVETTTTTIPSDVAVAQLSLHHHHHGQDDERYDHVRTPSPNPSVISSSSSNEHNIALEGMEEVLANGDREEEEEWAPLVRGPILPQENLSVCFVAALHLLNLERVDFLATDDLEMIIHAGISLARQQQQHQQQQQDDSGQNFDAVTELSERLESSTDLFELLNNGDYNGYLAFDRECLVNCMCECVKEARHNQKKKVAFFCILPSNRVFLAVYHDGNWWSWNTEPAMLECVLPEEVVSKWLTTVSADLIKEKGVTVKAAIFLPQICQDFAELESFSTARTQENHQEEKVEETVEIEPATTEDPGAFGEVEPVPPTRTPSVVQIPSSYLCPISYNLMADPVTAEDGHAYDRTQIQKHFKLRKTSPKTNLPMSTALVDNITLRNIIEEFVDQNEAVLDKVDLLDFRRRQKKRIKRTRNSGPKSPLLCELVQLTIPNEEDRVGTGNLGLAVALGDKSTRQVTSHGSFCSVGCCTRAIGPYPKWCERCQRATCRSCIIATVSNISKGKVYEKHSVCLECVWHIADTIANRDMAHLQHARDSILRDRVAPRLASIHQEMFELLYNLLLQQVNRESPIREILEQKEQFERLLRSHLNHPPETTIHPQSEMNTTRSRSSGLNALGQYNHDTGLPLRLSFPTPAMRRHIASLRQWRREAEPALRDRAVQQRIREIQNPSDTSISTQENSITLTDLLVDLPTAEKLAKNLIAQVDEDYDDDDDTAAESASQTLRMCAICPAGPFERLPDGGCPYCNWQEKNFEEWPLWEGDLPGSH